MDARPEPPPEGVLISSALKVAHISAREAARRAGVSDGWWRQIVNGYQSLSGGSYGIVRAPAKTLARMARVVGVTAAQMELEGRRPDAAALLDTPPELPDVKADADADLTDAIVAAAEAKERMNGYPASGEDMFPGDTTEAIWERMVWSDTVLPLRLRAETIAKARIARLPAQERNDRSALVRA
jgi:hypothetical protein